jgi:hypothetical protein
MESVEHAYVESWDPIRFEVSIGRCPSVVPISFATRALGLDPDR